ncbi:MAG: electron transfer flavoprotein subunit alpha/FixB family protein, partial [Thermodesulfobacteriota bacterium]
MAKAKRKKAEGAAQENRHRSLPTDPWSGVWVLGDVRNEGQKKAAANLLRRAGVLAEKRACGLSLILLGRGLEPALAPFLGLGADRIFLVDHSRLGSYRQETYTAVLESLVNRYRPEIFLFLANDCGRELAPRLAARLRTGLCADCIGLDIDPETGLLLQTVPAFGDHIYGRIVTPEKRPQMATVRPGVWMGEEDGAGSRARAEEIVKVAFPKGIQKDRVKLLGAEKEARAGEALEKARTVVCGGRGMGKEEGFRSLRYLASLIGAELGGTRPAVTGVGSARGVPV